MWRATSSRYSRAVVAIETLPGRAASGAERYEISACAVRVGNTSSEATAYTPIRFIIALPSGHARMTDRRSFDGLFDRRIERAASAAPARKRIEWQPRCHGPCGR